MYNLFGENTNIANPDYRFSPKKMLDNVFSDETEDWEEVDPRIRKMFLIGAQTNAEDLWWMFAQGMTKQEFYDEGFDAEEFFFISPQEFKAYSFLDLVRMYDLDSAIKNGVKENRFEETMFPDEKKVAIESIFDHIGKGVFSTDEVNRLDLLIILTVIFLENGELMHWKNIDKYDVSNIKLDQIKTSKPGKCYLSEDITCNFDNCNQCHQYYYELALEQFAKSKYDSALALLNACIELSPSFDPAYVLLGETYLYLNNLAKSKAMVEDGLRLNPNNVEGLEYQMKFSLVEDKPDQAEDYFQKAMQQINYNGSAHLSKLILEHRKLSKFEKEAAFEKMLTEYPTNYDILRYYAQFAADELNDPDKAAVAIAKAKSMAKDPRIVTNNDAHLYALTLMQEGFIPFDKPITEAYDEALSRIKNCDLILEKYKTLKSRNIDF